MTPNSRPQIMLSALKISDPKYVNLSSVLYPKYFFSVLKISDPKYVRLSLVSDPKYVHDHPHQKSQRVPPLGPKGNFKWMSEREISKIDLGKYKADGKKGLILEVDLEYPQELHDLHKDYPVAPEKVKVSKSILSGYCKKIADKYKISIGLVSKLIPTLKIKKSIEC